MNKNREIIQDFIEEEQTRVEETEEPSLIDGFVNAMGEVEIGNVAVPNAKEIAEVADKAVSSSVPKVKDVPLIPESAMKVTSSIGSFFSNLKSPTGGIAILLTIILFIVFAIKKVDGKETTRLGLLFQSFYMNTELEGFETKNGSEAAVDEVGDAIVKGKESGFIWSTADSLIKNSLLQGMVGEQ